ncbi:MAG: PSD1 and planctomycete cytochrome C domain-containing protein [Gemmataceae bacterium]|nr:PSD1 and planctomycete cytochrome C domain-containing protein [Gemmataceae bacterium]
MRRLGLWLGCWLSGLPVVAAEPANIDPRKLPAATPGTIDFARDIEPIFAKNCYSCHGPEKQRGGVRLDDAAAALKGGNSGTIIVPGKAAASRLLIVVAGLDRDLVMPPKEKMPLTAAEVGRLRAWIEQGAKWPRQAGGTTSAAKSAHWAFQPIRRVEPTVVKRQGWIRNDIDRFILARLESEKIAPSAEADRVTLIRRLSLDLLGLPPTPAEVDVFVRDSRPDAYGRLVERLLSAPHYGERWARHWLDLARYADSDGYEQDRPRPYHWRYRDWVIQAINRDLPFDQFTIEQLAGDLLPNATLAQKTATGFHRNTLTNREGGTDKEQFRVEACVDRVNTTAKVWLGLTLGCAQCHDHKYDPFSQREYYQFFAFFNPDNEVDVPAPLPGDAAARAAFDKRKAALERKLTDYQETQLGPTLAMFVRGLEAEDRKKLPDKIAKLLGKGDKLNAKERQLVFDYLGKDDKTYKQLSKALADHVKKPPTPAYVPTLAANGGRKTHVLIRGDFLRPGVAAAPGVPAVLPPLKSRGQPGRLDLARWVVSTENPLTARVITNWVWHHYFGRGLVATLEDFGAQGERPSHPELLDHLASQFMQCGWSLKRLHRYIVTSATYRQSSRVRPELAGRDPMNILLARQNRIRFEAEILRDNALAVSGLLVGKVGGPSVKPPQPAGISELTYANAARWVESKGEDRYRRGMYTWFQRTSPHPLLTMFDAPDANLSCVRRDRTNTPLQALTLLNDATFVECAQALAKRIMTDKTGSVSERLDHGFRLCVGRHPSAAEQEQLQTMYDEVLALAQANPKEAARLAGAASPANVPVAEGAAWVTVARMLMNLDEFVTRE